MLNMSHAVDSMSFGKMLSPAQQRLLPGEVGCSLGWTLPNPDPTLALTLTLTLTLTPTLTRTLTRTLTLTRTP